MKAAIVGYGNLGKSVEKVITASQDIDLYGIFSRRAKLDTTNPVFDVAEFEKHAKNIDVAYLCLGSATDIPTQAERFAKATNTVDTYDNHHYVPQHREEMDKVARESGHIAVVSTGWDPGMFSLARVYASAILPNATQNTFWGPGVSQGHSDALRRIKGVKRAVQYTIPLEQALEKARGAQAVGLTSYETHRRQCFIVADEADQDRIRKEIIEMPDYFVGYQVEVNFISEEEFLRDHTGMPHGGHVISAGEAGGTNHLIEYSLKLSANPDFTAAVAVAFGRAAYRLNMQGQTGARSVLEIPPYLLHPQPIAELVKMV